VVERQLPKLDVSGSNPDTRSSQSVAGNPAALLVVRGSALARLFRRLSEQLAFRIYAHKFRHTFATNLARQGPKVTL
jgi:hypothetical protein